MLALGCTRPAGFTNVPAVRHGAVYEIKSSLILQPGPAALTDGLAALQGIVERWAGWGE
jgi:iron complex transport system substrate-binding protein